jgi:cytochrome oxidase Cu insertion factor (SCO1/SenC/PrrC family)
MSETARARLALAALAAVLAITAGWWALALWPAGPAAPEWFVRTRAACFGSNQTGLPDAGGWLLLVGQPLGMTTVLLAVWRREVQAGLAGLMAGAAGQIALGLTTALLVVGAWNAGVRVWTAGVEPFSTGPADVAAPLTRLSDPAPPLALTDQGGREVSLASLRGRPVIVAFAYAHCQTVCPALVAEALEAGRRTADLDPAVLIVTLDPWRDTPSRLPSMARDWQLDDRAHVLSGDPELVERTLNAWRVPRTRNDRTGEIIHPALLYVVDREGRLAYALGGNAGVLAAAVQTL